jgi:NAD(P)-dependent dehydrogenase (short-subunit alcohol dehydrogenase family)
MRSCTSLAGATAVAAVIGPPWVDTNTLPKGNRPNDRSVTISSYVGQSGRIGQANYAAAKAGQFGLTKVLALETATKGITVNCVVPGGIETDMVAALPEQILKAAIDLIPMHALGKPDDVAEAVRYLVSDEAHYLTGALLPVAGGLLMM